MQKTSKLIKGIILKEEEIDTIQQEDKDLRLYNLCKKGKAIKYI